MNKNWFIKIPEPETVENNLEYKDGETQTSGIDSHQTILNIGYSWWQNPPQEIVESKKEIDYIDMIDYMSEKYGEIYAGLILIGKYNQQVYNGGHYQYYDNGYADGTGGCGSTHDFDHPLHRRLIEWYMELLSRVDKESEFYKDCIETLDVLKEFLKLEIDCDQEIEDREWEEDEEDENDLGHWEDTMVYNENYGQMDMPLSRELDKKYNITASKMLEQMNKVSSVVLGFECMEEFNKITGAKEVK